MSFSFATENPECARVSYAIARHYRIREGVNSESQTIPNEANLSDLAYLYNTSTRYCDEEQISGKSLQKALDLVHAKAKKHDPLYQKYTQGLSAPKLFQQKAKPLPPKTHETHAELSTRVHHSPGSADQFICEEKTQSSLKHYYSLLLADLEQEYQQLKELCPQHACSEDEMIAVHDTKLEVSMRALTLATALKSEKQKIWRNELIKLGQEHSLSNSFTYAHTEAVLAEIDGDFESASVLYQQLLDYVHENQSSTSVMGQTEAFADSHLRQALERVSTAGLHQCLKRYEQQKEVPQKKGLDALRKKALGFAEKMYLANPSEEQLKKFIGIAGKYLNRDMTKASFADEEIAKLENGHYKNAQIISEDAPLEDMLNALQAAEMKGETKPWYEVLHENAWFAWSEDFQTRLHLMIEKAQAHNPFEMHRQKATAYIFANQKKKAEAELLATREIFLEQHPQLRAFQKQEKFFSAQLNSATKQRYLTYINVLERLISINPTKADYQTELTQAYHSRELPDDVHNTLLTALAKLSLTQLEQNLQQLEEANKRWNREGEDASGNVVKNSAFKKRVSKTFDSTVDYLSKVLSENRFRASEQTKRDLATAILATALNKYRYELQFINRTALQSRRDRAQQMLLDNESSFDKVLTRLAPDIKDETAREWKARQILLSAQYTLNPLNPDTSVENTLKKVRFLLDNYGDTKTAQEFSQLPWAKQVGLIDHNGNFVGAEDYPKLKDTEAALATVAARSHLHAEALTNGALLSFASLLLPTKKAKLLWVTGSLFFTQLIPGTETKKEAELAYETGVQALDRNQAIDRFQENNLSMATQFSFASATFGVSSVVWKTTTPYLKGGASWASKSISRALYSNDIPVHSWIESGVYVSGLSGLGFAQSEIFRHTSNTFEEHGRKMLNMPYYRKDDPNADRLDWYIFMLPFTMLQPLQIGGRAVGGSGSSGLGKQRISGKAYWEAYDRGFLFPSSKPQLTQRLTRNAIDMAVPTALYQGARSYIDGDTLTDAQSRFALLYNRIMLTVGGVSYVSQLTHRPLTRIGQGLQKRSPLARKLAQFHGGRNFAAAARHNLRKTRNKRGNGPMDPPSGAVGSASNISKALHRIQTSFRIGESMRGQNKAPAY